MTFHRSERVLSDSWLVLVMAIVRPLFKKEFWKLMVVDWHLCIFDQQEQFHDCKLCILLF